MGDQSVARLAAPFFAILFIGTAVAVLVHDAVGGDVLRVVAASAILAVTLVLAFGYALGASSGASRR